jgi:hypothetical protein
MHHYHLELQHLDRLGHSLDRRRHRLPTFGKWHAVLLKELPRYKILDWRLHHWIDIYLCQKQ